jgi:murein DD-endopeptidase MepM/ murein hydrolase activator NlpD
MRQLSLINVKGHKLKLDTKPNNRTFAQSEAYWLRFLNLIHPKYTVAVLEKEKKKLIQKLKIKYKLVIMDSETFEEKLSFRLSRLNVFVVLGTISILLIFFTTYLIAFTQLREFIPGYANTTDSRTIYELTIKSDSLEEAMVQKDEYIKNIKNVLTGSIELPITSDTGASKKNYSNIANRRSADDSLLRLEVENRDKYSLYLPDQTSSSGTMTIKGFNFFTPVKGYITSKFSSPDKHFGIDIATQENEAVKAALDGTVVFSGWSVESGNVISIQHTSNIITVYKHNAVLLKKQGDYVKAGDPVAIVGTSGELSTGPHLHFELWYNGVAVDPQKYIRF